MLLENLTHIRNVINVSAATSYENLFSHLFSVEQKYIHKLISKELYNKLLEYLKNPSNELLNFQNVNPDFQDDFIEVLNDADVAYKRALFIIQRAIVHLGYFEGFDVLNAYISDGGFKRSESEEIKSLFKYQEDNIRRYYRETGFDGLDMILRFFETNIQHFPEHAPTLKAINSKVLPTTASFNSIIPIHNSRIIFLRLQPAIKAVEELKIQAIMGTANATKFLNGLASDPQKEYSTKLLPYIQPVAAYLASAMLMEESGADLTERGLYFEGIKGGISMNDIKLPAIEARIVSLIKRNNDLAQQYIIKLHKFMAENSSDWNSFTSPRSYLHERDNTAKRTFWV